MSSPRAQILEKLAAALLFGLLAGCASTEIVNQWSDPGYSSAAFQKIVVLGVSNQTALRRSFEDEFVAQLKATGVDAVPSYRVVPEQGQASEARLLEAVKQTGADGAIMTRLVRVEHKTQVTPGYYNPYPGHGFYGWYSSGWAGFYEPPRIYDYDVYTSETSLYDLRDNRVVWAGTVRTSDPGEINKEIKSYVKTVVDALKEKNLLRGGPRQGETGAKS